MGIDPGSLCTGLGIVEEVRGRLKAVHWEVIRCRGPFGERLHRIHAGLTRAISEFEPAAVALEDIFFATNPKSTIKLGQARGVSLLAAAQAGLPIHEYSPLEVKQSLTGYGRAGKDQVQGMVTRLLELSKAPEPLDASDALAVAICHLHHAPWRVKVQKAGSQGGS